MSAEGIRKCIQQEKELLDNAWKQIEPSMRANSQNLEEVLSWCNFYENGKFKFDFPLKEEIFQWSRKLTEEVTPGNKVLLAGFIKNPPNSKKTQYWHIDYGMNVNTILIPLVDQGCETATQIIETPIKSKGEVSPLGYEANYGQNVLDLMDRENAEFLRVVQIVCRSHSIIRMIGGTVHRGIANRSEQERILFYINTCPDDFNFIEEPLVVSNMTENNNKA